jgi:L-ascorbate metabolism protein UlaG (beta-lactamase superfamily)
VTRFFDAGPDQATVDPARSAGLEVTFVGHATALLDLGGVRVLTDPFLRSRLGPLERHGPLPDPSELAADVVLISHGHPDHFDPRSLESLPGHPILVVPSGLGPTARRVAGASAVVELEAGESINANGVSIRAVPARHWISPGAARAKPVGFVMEGPGDPEPGVRVYFAGDTARYVSMARQVGRVELALLPVWTWGPHLGPGHLGPRTAARVAADLGPRAVIPIHWGTLYPRHLHRVWRAPLVEPGERFAAHVREMAPGIDARVLRPGDRARIGRNPARI